MPRKKSKYTKTLEEALLHSGPLPMDLLCLTTGDVVVAVERCRQLVGLWIPVDSREFNTLMQLGLIEPAHKIAGRNKLWCWKDVFFVFVYLYLRSGWHMQRENAAFLAGVARDRLVVTLEDAKKSVLVVIPSGDEDGRIAFRVEGPVTPEFAGKLLALEIPGATSIGMDYWARLAFSLATDVMREKQQEALDDVEAKIEALKKKA